MSTDVQTLNDARPSTDTTQGISLALDDFHSYAILKKNGRYIVALQWLIRKMENMMTSWHGNWPLVRRIHRSSVMLSVLLARISCWTNSRTGYLKRNDTHITSLWRVYDALMAICLHHLSPFKLSTTWQSKSQCLYFTVCSAGVLRCFAPARRLVDRIKTELYF